MLNMRRLSETYDMRVFTDSGEYFGSVDEVVVTKNKVHGWRIKAAKNSILARVLGGAKGVVVPHQLVKSMGDIMIISNSAVPTSSSGSGKEELPQES